MKKILNNAFLGKKLQKEEIYKLLDLINNEEVTSEQVSAFLGSINTRKIKENIFSKKNKGITSFELSCFVKGLKRYSKNINFESEKGFMDVCGTGGDCLDTFNISTTVAIVVAACGVKIVKHGNRCVSSKCGSADVLEKLGVNINLNREKQQEMLDKYNITFLFAPDYNSCLSKIKKIRNALNIPTIFNLLGPLINPVKLNYQIIGVYDETKCEVMINTLRYLDIKEAMVVHSKDGLDELSISSLNTIYHLKNKKIKKIKLPKLKDMGLKNAPLSEIKGGTAEENAQIILDILNGKKSAKRDVVLLNSAMALVVYGVAHDFIEGVEIARSAIDSKRALEVLEGMKNVSR